MDWKADHAPTHPLDHVTGIIKSGSGDPYVVPTHGDLRPLLIISVLQSSVNVVLYIKSESGGEASLSMANNVGAGSYTIQVPNQYPGAIPSGMTPSDYLCVLFLFVWLLCLHA